MSLTEEHVPSPADTPDFDAEGLLLEIEQLGGRIFRMSEPSRVFVVTTEEDLARWLMLLGGKPFLPPHLDPADLAPKSAYQRTKGVWEWDIEIGMVPVSGEITLWEAAAAFKGGKRVE